MKTELKEISPTQRELNIQIDPAAIKEAYTKVSQKYANGASVPGFRKGYAPLDVVRLRYKDEIKNEVLQQILPPAVTEAIQEHGLQPLAEPHLHIEDAENIKVNGSQPISLQVHVEVMPEIPMPKYEGIEITRRVRPVEDGEVEDLIADRLGREAALLPVDGRPSEIGDTVIADLEGTFEDDPEGEPIRADDLEVKLGDEVIERSFTENLIGVREDEEKEFEVSYPADFTSSALAGRTVHYKAKIKSVGRMETPELNDEWAKSLDEGYESLADLRKMLRADLEIYAKSDADARLRNNAIAKLIEENAFEVPNTLIESQARNLLNNFARDMQQRGVDLNKVEEDFVRMAYEQMRTQAERDVRGAMLLEKVAEMEKIEVSDDEVEAELQSMADHYKSSLEEIRTTFEKQNGLVSIKNNLKTRKAIEALVENAKVIEGDWVDETVGEPARSASTTKAKEVKNKSKSKAAPGKNPPEKKKKLKQSVAKS
jgi:trigger factor